MSRKKILSFVVSAFLLVPIAHAILPAFAAAWLISGTNLLIADLVAAQTAIISGVLWYDCNGFTSLTSCKSSGQSSINPTSVSNTVSGSSSTVPIQVKLNPDSTRGNPNPKTWDDATQANRSPTPKASVSQTSLYSPSSGGFNMDSMVYQSLDTPVETYGAPNLGNNTVSKVTYLTPSNKLNPGAPYTSYSTWTLTSGAKSGQSFVIYSKTEVVPYTCPTGYTQSGSNCVLTVAPASVQKPANTKCEVLYSAASQTFSFDAQNPNCSGLDSSLVSGGVLSSPAGSSGEKISVKPTSNGGFNICDSQPNGAWDCVQTGPYSPSSGGYPATGSTSGTGGTVGDATNSGSTNAGTGTSTGSGTTTGGGSCGGAGQSPCSISGDGIDGKSFDPSSSSSGIDTAHNNILNSIRSTLPSAPSWSWLVPITPVACSPLNLTFKGFPIKIDWCPFVDIYQQVLSFLGYLFTAFLLFELATRPASRS